MPEGVVFILASVVCSSLAHFILKIGANELTAVDVGAEFASRSLEVRIASRLPSS